MGLFQNLLNKPVPRLVPSAKPQLTFGQLLGQISPFSMKSSVVPTFRGLSDSFTYNGQHLNLEPIAWRTKGMFNLTPFRGTPDPIPATTPQQKQWEREGAAAYGMALTYPLGGFRGILSRAVQGAALNTGINTVSNVIKQRPLTENLGQSALEGIENSWQLALTNTAADKLAGKFFPSLVSNKTNQAFNLMKNASRMNASPAVMRGLLKAGTTTLGKRALLETAVEAPFFTATGKLTGRDTDPLPTSLAKNTFGALLGNLMYAGGSTALQTGMNYNRPMFDKVVSTLKNQEGFVNPKEVMGSNYADRWKNRAKQGLTETEVQAEYLSKKYGLEAGFVGRMQKQGFNVAQIERAAGYAADTTNPVKSKEGYVYDFLVTDGFTKPKPQATKISKEEIDDLLTRYRPDEVKRMVEEYGKPPFKPVDPYEGRGFLPVEEPVIKPEANTTIPADVALIAEKHGITDPKQIARINDLYQRFDQNPDIVDGIMSGNKPKDTVKPTVEAPPKPKSPIFEEQIMTAKTTQDVEAVMQEAQKRLVEFDQILKERGTDLETVWKNQEMGFKDENTKLLEKWFSLGKQRAEADGIKIHTLENYATHNTQDRALDILSKPSTPDTFGSILQTPYFAKKRTGALVDYDMTPEVMMAYLKESLKNANLSPEVKEELKIASTIVDEVVEKTSKAADNAVAPKVKLSITERITEAVRTGKLKPPDNPTIYDDFTPNNRWFRWLDDRASARNTSQAFYDHFLWPFKQAQIKSSNYAYATSKLDDNALYDLFLKDGWVIPREKFAKMDRNLVIEKLININFARNKTEATNLFMKNVRNGVFVKNGMTGLVDDIFQEYVVDPIRARTLAEKVQSVITTNTSRATIGGNVATAINNIFEIKRPFSLVDKKLWPQVAVALKETDKPFTVKYGIDSRVGTNTERALDTRAKLGKVLEKFDKVLFWMFDKTEYSKDEVMLAGFETQGKAKGLTGDDLAKYVRQKFDKFAIKYGTGQNTTAFKNPIVKVAFQYAHYFLKDSVILKDMLADAFKNDKGAQNYLIKYLSITIAQAVAMKALIGMWGFGNTTSTPFDVLNDVVDKKIPFLSPTSQLLINLGNLAFNSNLQKLDAEERKEKIGESLQQIGKNVASMTIPAANQVYNKTYKYWDARNRGFYETGGGNVAGPVGTGVGDTIKGTLFGPSYDSKRQEYFAAKNAGESPWLGEKQSEAYKKLMLNNPELAKTFYDQIQTNREKARMKPGTTPTGSGFQQVNAASGGVTPKPFSTSPASIYDILQKNDVESDKRRMITEAMFGEDSGYEGMSQDQKLQALQAQGITAKDIQDWELYQYQHLPVEDRASVIAAEANPDFTALYKNKVLTLEVAKELERRGVIESADDLMDKLKLTDVYYANKALRSAGKKKVSAILKARAATDKKALQAAISFNNKISAEVAKPVRRKSTKNLKVKLPKGKTMTQILKASKPKRLNRKKYKI